MKGVEEIKSWLTDERLMFRFTALYLTGLALFLLAWVVGYYLLPEGVLQGVLGASRLAGSDRPSEPVREAVKIFILNLFPLVFIVAANYTLRIKSFPLGYIIPLAYMVLYGITIGTNSFSVPMTVRMPPSFAVLQRSGLYEMAAYALLAAATATISRYRLVRFSSPAEEMPAGEIPGFSNTQKLGVGLAVLILLVASWHEALMLFSS